MDRGTSTDNDPELCASYGTLWSSPRFSFRGIHRACGPSVDSAYDSPEHRAISVNAFSVSVQFYYKTARQEKSNSFTFPGNVSQRPGVVLFLVSALILFPPIFTFL